MASEEGALSGMNFLDKQTYVGITKHMAGVEATNELLSLRHLEDARQVLNVGCGIGVGPAHIARKYGCRVVGVDISEKMIEWSRRRAREERVEVRVEFRTAVKSRIQWIGWRWLLRVWGRGVRLYITNPAVRQSIKGMFDVPAEVFEHAGNGLFAGRK